MTIQVIFPGGDNDDDDDDDDNDDREELPLPMVMVSLQSSSVWDGIEGVEGEERCVYKPHRKLKTAIFFISIALSAISLPISIGMT